MTEGVLYELWSPCLDCQENKRTCEFHYGSICQGSHPCWQLLNALIDPLGLCNKNFKCKPWRRKSLLKDVSKWTCFDLMLTTIFLLFYLSTKLVQGVSYFLQKTSSFKRNSNFLWGLLFISSFGGISFPLALCQEGIQPESSPNRLELPNAVVYVGSPFNYSIPENVFDCEVDRILVSESADRFLSNWLTYNSDKRQLYGVPSEKDKGTYILLVVAFMGEGNAGVHICGSRSFSIKVVPVREQLPVSVYISTGATGDDDEPVSRSFCVPGAQVVQGTAVLNADVESLNGHERMTMILKMAEHLSMPSDRVSFFSGHASHPIVDQLDSPAVIAAGAGDGRFAKGSRSLLTWLIGCGAIKLSDLPLSKLDADAQDGTISTLLGVPVVGWHVISGAQRKRARRRIRRDVMGVTATPTPMPSSSPPSTRSSVSTFVIISPTTILTSVSSDSSTILLSATNVSSLAVNTTSVSSSAINIKSRVSTQPLSTTKILLSSAVNISRSMERSTLASSFSTPSLTITTTKSVSSSIISSLSLSTTSIMNRSVTQVSPSQTLVSQVSAVSLLNSTSVPISPVSSFSVLSSGSPNLTTLQFTSETTSTPQLNLSTRMLSSSPSLLTTFAINSSVLTTGFLNNISTSMRTLESLNPFSSFLTLSETTVEGITSSIFGEMETTAVRNRTTRKLTPRHTSTVPMMSSVVTNTSSFVASSFHSSTTMLSSSFFWLSSLTLPVSATASVVENLTTSSMQPNISSTAVAVSSLTASPIVTSLNFRSMETSVNASFVLVNSTSEISRSLSPSLRPTGNGTFSTTTTEVGISSETINGSAVVISNSPSLSKPSFPSFAALSSFRSEFTGSRTSDSSVFATRSLFGGNSTTVPRTLGSSSSVVTTPSNLSVHSITTRKLFTFFSTPAGKSSTLVPSSSTSFPTASPSVAVSPFSKQILPSTILLRDSSSLFEASASVVESSVNATSFVASSTVVSRGTVRFENKSSVVTSTLAPQSLRTATRSITVLSGTSLQIPTTIQPTSRIFASSLSVFGGRSSPLLSSRFGINGSATVPTSVSETLTTTRSTPIFVTVTPSSLSTQNVSTLTSFTGLASAIFTLTPVFTRSSPMTAIYSGFVDVSGRIPTSSSLLSTTVTPANKTSSFGMFQSSPSILPSSNSTPMLTPTVSVVTLSVMPSSSIIRPTTAPPNSPPQLYNDMGRISVTAGKALIFAIPVDTFYDSEDQANTRGLSLSIVFASGASIPSDFWLQFDNITQTIYGLPLSAHVPSGVTGETFILQAQDSQGALAFDAFEVFVVPSEKPVVQELKIRVANDFLSFSRNVSQRLLLLEKIAAYFGDLDRSVVRVLEFAPGSVIMTWTNDSLPTDNCDEKKLEYVANRIFIDGEIREEFKDALEGFPVESGSQRRLGVCNESEVDGGATIIPAQQTHDQESDLWYKHVLVGLLVVVLVVVFVVLLIWYCRRRRPRPFNEKRTFKKRKPIILGQEIELKPIPGKPLVLPNDDPSKPPSYMSETSFDQPVSSDDDDDDDEVDYGKRSPLVRYEPPPPFHAAPADDPRTSPPPAYVMPPMY
ncbi:mucin-5AC-like isoform X5 [Montipora capricornis]|uniref:mucin-5AC-like isoform X5 n=1 Tax=Montipora capricornis TaxID=246305 RepID=UPI0035F18A4B